MLQSRPRSDLNPTNVQGREEFPIATARPPGALELKRHHVCIPIPLSLKR